MNLPGAWLLAASDFHKIRTLAHAQFGLSLPDGKQALVAARVGQKIREGNFRGFADYYRHVMSDRTGAALRELIDSLTTNHTAFLREPAHFEALRAAATGEFREAACLRVWCAACSSGEEAYSIAMTLLDAAARWRCGWANQIQIVASDVSTRMLSRARTGIYQAARVEKLSGAWRRAFLLKGGGARQGWYKVKPAVRELISFERVNLIEPLPRRVFDFIFCRNVMLYVDKPTQQDMVRRLSGCLAPGGYLFIGHSETLNGIDHPLSYVCPATYVNAKRGRA